MRACCAPRSARRSPASSKTPSIVEVMLNPDGRLWIDRLSGGLEDTGRTLSAADGERIVRLVAHHVGAEVHAEQPACLGRAARDGGAVRGTAAAGRRRARPLRSASPPSRSSPSTTMSPPASCWPARRRRSAPPWRPQEHPRRRRHLDRQDDAHQRAPGRDRRHQRPRGADRGHPRAAMPRAEPRRAAHQGRRRLALRPRPLLAAPAARPHPDRRGARRRGAGPPEGVGHRPSRAASARSTPAPRSARCAASNSSSRKPSSPSPRR